MIWVTSSTTPSIVENSCRTPSIWIVVTAVPGSEDNRIRRNEFYNEFTEFGIFADLNRFNSWFFNFDHLSIYPFQNVKFMLVSPLRFVT